MIPINANALITFTVTDEDGAAVDDATVTAVLQDRDTRISFFGIDAITLSSAGSGVYEGTIPYAQTNLLTEDQEIRVQFTVSRSGVQTYPHEDHLARYASA